jgi:phosphoglycerate dehydrogenase-like enzyme
LAFRSLHVSLTDATRGLIDRHPFELMKPTAGLVNTARGPVVDTGALYGALAEGQIAHAALDVTDPEPLPADHPLVSLRNLIVVPHIGSATVATRTEMARTAVRNLLAGLDGQQVPHQVNEL